MAVNEDNKKAREEQEMDEWQAYFCKLFSKLFSRRGHMGNAKVRADIFDILRPVQQKGHRAPLSQQEKVDKKITRLTQRDI